MTDPTAQFFDDLGDRGHEPLLEKARGTLRFDLQENGHTDHWLVEVDKGDLAVSHDDGPATCTIRADKAVFDQMTAGEVNAAAAVLRGAIEVEGNSELLLLFQRLLPSPPRRPPAKKVDRGAGAR